MVVSSACVGSCEAARYSTAAACSAAISSLQSAALFCCNHSLPSPACSACDINCLQFHMLMSAGNCLNTNFCCQVFLPTWPHSVSMPADSPCTTE